MASLHSKKNEQESSDGLAALSAMWQRNKEAYKTKEIGNGVQKFVNRVLQSSVFDLKEGDPGIAEHKRSKEFTEEESKKEGRADMVIFIDSEVQIPIEVEKHTHIIDGEDQIVKYQLQWQKHYGILTDGFEWRFYNNNVFKTYYIDEILSDENTEFLVFWADYIKSDNYYLNYFSEYAEKAEDYYIYSMPVESSRAVFFEDIKNLIDTFKEKLNVSGFFKKMTLKERDKRATEITYSYLIQFILYKTLVDNDYDAYKAKFGELVGLIYSNLRDKHYKAVLLSVINLIAKDISSDIYKPFKKEQGCIDQTLEQLVRKPRNSIADVSPWLDIFVFIKKYNFANIQNEIFGYVYENYLKVVHGDEDKGQYFTDPAVVDFMLDAVGYTQPAIKVRHINEPTGASLSLIDPACGSGTFLYSALNRIMESLNPNDEEDSQYIEDLVRQHIFGLDVAEFPLYLAEMNMIMRMLPIIIDSEFNNPVDKKLKLFETKDSVAEFINDSHVLKSEPTSFMRVTEDLDELKNSITENEIPRRRFDFVVANPPYISYNKCAKGGVQIFKLIKAKVVELSNIYDVNLHSVPGNPKKYAPKPNLFAFFIALGLRLLKENGRLCYIIPQTLLTAGDLDVLRYHLANSTTIEKIITFSSSMFVGRGLSQAEVVPTSSLIIVLNPRLAAPSHKVQVINYKGGEEAVQEVITNLRKGINTEIKAIPQKELAEKIENWNFITKPADFLNIHAKYIANSNSLEQYYSHKLAKEKFGTAFFFDTGAVIDKKHYIHRTKVKKKADYFRMFDYRDNAGYVLQFNDYFYPKREELVKIQHGSQGYETFLKKFKIIWSVRNAKNFQFTAEDCMFSINQARVIASDNYAEMLFLFGILNSSLVSYILEGLLRNENEKDYFVAIKSVKQYVRVPKVSKKNTKLKKELIGLVEKLLIEEQLKVRDCVDFSHVSLQKFNKIAVRDNNVLLGKDEFECRIKKRKHDVAQLIGKLDGAELTLAELKDLTLINEANRAKLLEKIDKLVFKLYELRNEDIEIVTSPLPIKTTEAVTPKRGRKAKKQLTAEEIRKKELQLAKEKSRKRRIRKGKE